MRAPGDVPGGGSRGTEVQHPCQPRKLHQVSHLQRPRQHERGVLQPEHPPDVCPRPLLGPLQMCCATRCTAAVVEHGC